MLWLSKFFAIEFYKEIIGKWHNFFVKLSLYNKIRL